VLTTSRTSLPEVGGDAVAYSEPDAAALSTALAALLDEPARRTSLGAAALLRARTFTWEASAEAHLRAYAQAARA
jgi:glycosyltransferase involved in cell wall biosynthesis